MRDAPFLLIGEGTADIQRIIIGKRLLGCSCADRCGAVVRELVPAGRSRRAPAMWGGSATSPRPRDGERRHRRWRQRSIGALFRAAPVLRMEGCG